MDYGQLGNFVTNVLFVTTLGWYLITNLQWYDYKIERVVLKHHKPLWHVGYFIIPFITPVDGDRKLIAIPAITTKETK